MYSPPIINPDSYDFADSTAVIALARTLVDGAHAGVLSSVNEHGGPEVRWMDTLSFEEFPILYTLTAPDSRKVEQIQINPAVNWMFSNHDHSLVLNLIGTARILTDTPSLKRVWQQIVNKSHTYFLNRYCTGPGFVVIETTVSAIECFSPGNYHRIALDPAAFAAFFDPAT